MSAPSDGARADARKARVAVVAGDDLSALMVLSLAQEIRVVDGNHDLGAGALADALTPWLAGVIADAKAEALREAAREWPAAQWWGEFDDWLRERAEIGR